MIWNHDISAAPRTGSHFLMATTDGKRFLTRWLEPTKFTPNGRFDGFSESAKTLLAWCAVPEHPFAAASQGEAAAHSPESETDREAAEQRAGANAGGGHVTDGENTHSVAAGEHVNSSPAPLITHHHIFLGDAGSGA